MPCYDPFAFMPNISKVIEELDRFSEEDLLCKACFILTENKLITPELTKWFSEHRELDRTKRISDLETLLTQTSEYVYYNGKSGKIAEIKLRIEQLKSASNDDLMRKRL
jgi:hypothetical protein